MSPPRKMCINLHVWYPTRGADRNRCPYCRKEPVDVGRALNIIDAINARAREADADKPAR